jgi:hypothetical protein
VSEPALALTLSHRGAELQPAHSFRPVPERGLTALRYASNRGVAENCIVPGEPSGDAPAYAGLFAVNSS